MVTGCVPRVVEEKDVLEAKGIYVPLPPDPNPNPRRRLTPALSGDMASPFFFQKLSVPMTTFIRVHAAEPYQRWGAHGGGAAS